MRLICQLTHCQEPVAAQRPRWDSKRGRTYTPGNFGKYKKKLAKSLRLQVPELPKLPAKGTKERSAYLAANRYHLVVMIYRKRNVGDIDNYLKSVQDALQDAGIIADDTQIDSIEAKKWIDKENPRVELQLWGIEQ